MTDYIHRLTMACPEHLIPQANQLAVIAGESASDINTFREANYQSGSGGLYSVCSAVAKPSLLSYLDSTITELPEHAQTADIKQAQEALDSINNPGGLILVVDVEPRQAIEDMGLTLVETNPEG